MRIEWIEAPGHSMTAPDIFDVVASLIGVAMTTATSGLRHDDVTSPCHPDPCDVTQVCDVIRRHHCTSTRDCRRFVCRPGTCLLTDLLS